jgi:hypothetical protein
MASASRWCRFIKYQAEEAFMLQAAQVNVFFDRLVHPHVWLFGRQRPRFLVLGWSGYLLALLLTQGLAARRGLSGGDLLLVSLCAAATFFGQAMLVKVWLGQERLVYYHQLLAVLAVSAGLLSLLRQPVLPYLDLTLMGVGTMLAVGRLGCLMAGCCHGRPSDWGVCYKQEYLAAGFPSHFVGVRLFPLQAIEAGWVGLAVLVGSLRLLAGAVPGEALAFYLLAYAAGRFIFEFLRGDPDRCYRLGFSEAQWTSLLIALFVLGFEAFGWLPLLRFHLAIAGMLFGTAIWMVVGHNLGSGFTEISARQLDEIARAVSRISPSDQVQMVTTPFGLYISASQVPQAANLNLETGRSRLLYAFSQQPEPLTPAAAQSLARLIARLKHLQSPNDLGSSSHGIFYWLAETSGDRAWERRQ